MSMKLTIAPAALVLAMALSCPGSLLAQEAVLEEFYGSGVHKYFSGDYSGADADLTAAVDGGSRDPRVYYFRGLARTRYGGDSTADFQRGADLEAADSSQYYPIGKSLERVQGSTRMSLERYRSLARATAYSRSQQRDAIRYQQQQHRESQVLRAPVAAPPTRASAVEPLPARPAVALPVPAPPAAEDPFADDAVQKPAPMPALTCSGECGRACGWHRPRCRRLRRLPRLRNRPPPTIRLPNPTRSRPRLPLRRPRNRPRPEPPTAASDDPFAEPPGGDDAEMKDESAADAPPAADRRGRTACGGTTQRPSRRPAEPAAAEDDPFAEPKQP